MDVLQIFLAVVAVGLLGYAIFSIARRKANEKK